MTPTLAAFLAVVSLAAAAQSVACALLVRRARAATAAAQVADLAARLHVVEARLAHLEASRTSAERTQAPTPDAEAGRSHRVDRRRPASTAGPVLIAVPSLAAAPSAAGVTAAAAEFDRRFGAVFALADAGAPADEVARQTGYPVGQVELILGLRPTHAAAAAAPGAWPNLRRDDADA